MTTTCRIGDGAAAAPGESDREETGVWSESVARAGPAAELVEDGGPLARAGLAAGAAPAMTAPVAATSRATVPVRLDQTGNVLMRDIKSSRSSGYVVGLSD
jgi:hypothetical protein